MTTRPGREVAREVADLTELRDALYLEILEMADALAQEVTQLDVDLDPIRRKAHAAWFRGERAEWVRLGERAYQRARRRTRVACGSCGRVVFRRNLPKHRRIFGH